MHRTPEATWPAAGRALVAELRGRPGRLCLIDGATTQTDAIAAWLQTGLDLRVARVGALLCGQGQPCPPNEIQALLEHYELLTDLDILMWPALGVAVPALLRALARKGPLLSVWPGTIEGNHARYSDLGRPDSYDITLSDAVILRPRPSRNPWLPDDVRYDVERIGS